MVRKILVGFFVMIALCSAYLLMGDWFFSKSADKTPQNAMSSLVGNLKNGQAMVQQAQRDARPGSQGLGWGTEENESDERFVKEVISLKKEKVLAQLHADIARLGGEGSSASPSNPQSQKTGAGKPSLPPMPPRDPQKVPANDYNAGEPAPVPLVINAATKTAVLSMGGRAQKVKEGGAVGSITVKKIERDSVTVVWSDGRQETVFPSLQQSPGSVKKGVPESAASNAGGK